MPELPEVEGLAADLRSRAVGRCIERVDVAAVSVMKTYDPPPAVLHGRQIVDAGRHGKFLDLGIEGGLHLVVHLARAGWLHYRTSVSAAPLRPGRGPIALRISFTGGEGLDLTEAGTQKKLAVYLITDPKTVPGIARLGPDALAVDQAAFTSAVRSRRGQLKKVLTDQEVLAGVGNAYSDEILYRAGLSPFAISDRLPDEQLATLYMAVRDVLAEAVARSTGQPAANMKAEKKSGLAVHNRTGLPCPACGDTIRAVSFADSSLQYCPTCQTGGRILADRRLSRLIR